MLSIKRAHESRWRGTTSDLAVIANSALKLLKERVGAEPPLEVVLKSQMDEDRYSSVGEFEDGIKSLELRDVAAIKIVAGSISSTEAVVSVTFSKQSVPAVTVEVEGPDRILNKGLCEEVARQIKRGRQINISPFVTYLAFGLIGVAFALLFLQVNWLSFLPDNWMGSAVVSVIYVVVYGCLLFVMIAAFNWLFPVLELLPPGGSPKLTVWKQRLTALAIFVGGAAITGLVGLALTHLFGTKP